MSADIAAIADAAARAVASMFVVLGVGVALAYTGNLDAQGLKALGLTINWVFVPAILFDSFGAGLSWEVLQKLWVVAIVGLFTAPLSAIFSYPSMVLSKPPDWFRPWFIFGVTFQNTVALPLVLVQTVCLQIKVPQRDESGIILTGENGTALWMSQLQCTTRGELYIFMYIFLHSLLFWIVAYDVMPRKKQPESEITDDRDVEDGEVESGSAASKSLEPAMVLGDGALSTQTLLHDSASTAGGTSGTISLPSMVQLVPLDDLKHGAESSDFAPVKSVTGSPAGISRTSPRASNLARLSQTGDYIPGSFYGGVEQIEAVRQVAEQTIEKRPKTIARKVKAKAIWLFFHIISLCARPPIIAQLLGTFIGLIKPLQDLFFGSTSVLRPLTLSIKIFAVASTAVTNLSMAGGLGLKIKQVQPKYLFGGEPGGLSRRATMGFVMTRMFIIPGVLFGLTYMLQVTKIVPNDRLLLMVLYMQTMTPSANTCVIVPQILGDHQASGALSLLVLSQYMIALPTMLLWLSLAFWVTADIL